MDKKCNFCLEIKDEALFNKRGLKCKKCTSIYFVQYRKNNHEKLYTYRKKYKEENLEKERLWFLNFYSKNKDNEVKKASEWNRVNRERRKEITNKYNKTSNGRILRKFISSKRRVNKESKISNFFKKEIIDIYLRCPKGYQVDHIVPLVNKKVCGLHVPWNLQYLTPIENITKSNKF